MPRPEKVQAVEEIREQLDEARATFVTEYRGLTVAEQQQLRRSVNKAQGRYRVVKMSLARLAVEHLDLEEFTELLAGPTALAFANDDPVPVAKALRDFASDHENLVIKGGLLGGELLPPEQISRLAEIESREVLLSKIAGGIKAPMAKMAGMLGAKVRDAASMFSQLLEKKEEEAPAPVAEEAPAVEAEEAPAVAVEEASAAEAGEATDAEAEETPAVEVEEASAAEVEEAPAVEVEEASAAEVEEAPAVEVEEASAAEVEEAPAVAVEEVTEADEAPKLEKAEAPKEAEEVQEAEAEKAASKTKKKKAETDEAAAEGSDDTAEED